MFIQIICPWKKLGYFLLLNFFSKLLIYYWYVTDINPLSHGWLTNIFFHSEICVFFLLFPLLSRHRLVWHDLIYQFLVLHPVCFGFYHYLSNILKCFLCNINIRLKIIWKTSCIHDPITPSYYNCLGPSPQHLLTLFVEYYYSSCSSNRGRLCEEVPLLWPNLQAIVLAAHVFIFSFGRYPKDVAMNKTHTLSK